MKRLRNFTLAWENTKRTLELVTLIMYFSNIFLNLIITSTSNLKRCLFTFIIKYEDEFSRTMLFHFVLPETIDRVFIFLCTRADPFWIVSIHLIFSSHIPSLILPLFFFFLPHFDSKNFSINEWKINSIQNQDKSTDEIWKTKERKNKPKKKQQWFTN